MNVPAETPNESMSNTIGPEHESAPEGHNSDTNPHNANPFSDSGVTGLFYPGAGRQEALEQLGHLLRYGPSLVLLYGDQGVGKHFLIDHLIVQLDADLFDVSLLNGDIMTTASALLDCCSDAWHARQPFSMENFQEKSVEVASAADDESKILLCVVKHSQFLDQETCEVIVELLASCAGLPVKFLLVADAPELSAAEQIEGLAERVPNHLAIELLPLNSQETQEYLNYRLRTAGLGQVRFNEQQVSQIYNHSLGNIVRINEVAQALLVAAMPKPKPKQNAVSALPLPWMHLAALGLVAVALVLLLFMNQPQDEQATSAQSQGAGVATLPNQDAQKVLAESVAEVPESVSEAPSGHTNTEDRDANGNADPSVDFNYAEEEGNSIAQQPSAKPVVPIESQKTSVVAPDDAKPEAQKTVSAKPESTKPASTKLASATPAPKQEKWIAEAIESKPKPAPKPVSKPAPDRAPKAEVSASKPFDARAAWLMSLPKQHYSVQLLGAKELSTVHRFLALYPSLQNLVYYKTTRNGAPWYVVVQGNYPDYASAKAATQKYPEKLRKQGPWIRKVEAIQKDLSN